MVSVGPAGSQRVPAPLGVQPLGKDWLRSSWSASLGQEDPLEKGMATHSSIAWRIPWTEEPGGLQSVGLQRVGHDRATLREPVERDSALVWVLPEIQGTVTPCCRDSRVSLLGKRSQEAGGAIGTEEKQ